MNVTLSIDDELLARSREIARRQGSSLNDLIRRYLESIVGNDSGNALSEELTTLWEKYPGSSGGHPIFREDAYEGRL